LCSPKREENKILHNKENQIITIFDDVSSYDSNWPEDKMM